MAHKKQVVIAFLGTGMMGAPMAHNLQKSGFQVRAWNRTRAKAEPLISSGIKVVDTPQEAVRGADMIITMLKDGPAIRETMQAAKTGLSPGMIWLQMSTVGVKGIEELAALASEQQLIFYDVPVQGTRQPAEQGKLIILASGASEHRSDVQPVFDAIGQRTVWVSEQVGQSSRLKLALNSWVMALTHGVAESLAIAKGLGIDPAWVVDVVSGGPMDSGYFQMKSAAILGNDYAPSFSVVNALKDSKLVVEAAKEAGVQVDTIESGIQRFERVIASGHGEKDMAASHLASKSE